MLVKILPHYVEDTYNPLYLYFKKHSEFFICLLFIKQIPLASMIYPLICCLVFSLFILTHLHFLFFSARVIHFFSIILLATLIFLTLYQLVSCSQ